MLWYFPHNIYINNIQYIVFVSISRFENFQIPVYEVGWSLRVSA